MSQVLISFEIARLDPLPDDAKHELAVPASVVGRATAERRASALVVGLVSRHRPARSRQARSPDDVCDGGLRRAPAPEPSHVLVVLEAQGARMVCVGSVRAGDRVCVDGR